MNNYKMLLEYDGGRYDGWQRIGKDESGNTIENKIVEVLEKMTGGKVEVYCALRTERGVHATGQVANFKTHMHFKDYEVRNYLNRYLPRDIAVLEVEKVDERFSSKLNAISKTYLYKIDMQDIASVFERKYKYHSFQKLDVEAMREAAARLEGERDFKNFSSVKKNKETRKRVEKIVFYDDGSEVSISITANDFLHNMARMLVGFLLDVGNGKRRPCEADEIFNGTGEPSIPAECHGLYLDAITYR